MNSPVETAPARTQPFTLEALDGYPLGATRFPACGPLRGSLVVAGATGVPQGFYRRFAEHASGHGYEVLTFDYRGIGRSKPASLKGFEMEYLDWARLDLAAAIKQLDSGPAPLFMVGHSFGGHAFGLLPNHQRVAGAYIFGTGAGWHGWMPLCERLKVMAMWNLIFPGLTAWKGYSPWKMLGLGEDLPLGVYRQWRRWCQFPRYFFDDPQMPGISEPFAAVRTPIVAANALDDLWALPRSRDAFVQAYCNAPLQRRDIDPAPFGHLGHMGYFRPAAQPLWDEALEWFAQQV